MDQELVGKYLSVDKNKHNGVHAPRLSHSWGLIGFYSFGIKGFYSWEVKVFYTRGTTGFLLKGGVKGFYSWGLKGFYS